MRFCHCWLVFFLSGLILISCKEDPEPIDEQEEFIQDKLEDAGISALHDPNGFFYYPLVENPTGTPGGTGAVFSIYYQERIFEGDDIHAEQSNAIRLKQGVNAVYPRGLDLALQHMRTGERWVVILPAHLAYEDHEFESLIPERSIIEFEVEVVNIESEAYVYLEEAANIQDYILVNDLDDTVNHPLDPTIDIGAGVVYKRLAEGDGGPEPLAGQEVVLAYSSFRLNGSKISEATVTKPFRFIHEAQMVIPGLDAGVSRMQRGERALLIIPSAQAYRESAVIIPAVIADELVAEDVVPAYASLVGPYQALIFELTLIDIL